MKIIVAIILGFLVSANASAQTQAATQLLLNYEKLKQLEEILDNMYKGYKVLSQGYDRIKGFAEGNYKLHQVFLDGLFAVSPAVRDYRRIPMIIEYQALLNREYKRAYQRFRDDGNFSPDELRYLERVYTHLVKQSLRNLQELIMIVTASRLRMTDEERLKAIDRVFFDMESKLSFLRYFNNSAQVLSMQRAKERSEVTTIQSLYELEQ